MSPLSSWAPGPRAHRPFTTPNEVVLAGEKHRIRFVAIAILLTSIGFLLADAIDHAPARTHPIATAGAILLCVSAAAALVVTRGPGYDPRVGFIFGVCVALGLGAGFTSWGPFSMHVAFLMVAVLVFAQNALRAGAITIAVLALGVHLVPGLLVITGGGLAGSVDFQAGPGTSPGTLVRSLLVVQGVILGLFFAGRRAHNTQTRALRGLQLAQRENARQEALLSEAQRDLGRLVVTGGPGRYTGQVLGSYKMGALIGRGGMGEVYLGEHVGGGPPAAVKVLHTHRLNDPQLVRRFLREAELASALDTDNIVRVREISGEDDVLPYIAMECLHGQTLNDFLRVDPKGVWAELVPMVSGVAAGLDVAHAKSIVHRDIKPQNIFRHLDGHQVVWKVLDFGVAVLATGSATITQSKVLGTPSYMAPEQAAGERVGPACDVYALGALIYRVLTGRPPFDFADGRQTMIAVVSRAPIRPSDLADIEDDVDSLLALALARDPAHRFASAGELAQALPGALQGSLSPVLRTRAARLLIKRPWARLHEEFDASNRDAIDRSAPTP